MVGSGSAHSGGQAARRARRVGARRWRDLRLLTGVALVGVAMVAGGRIVAQADQTVQYWAVADDVRAGDPVERADLVATRVRLDGGQADAYVRVDEELPASLEDLSWANDLRAGLLVPDSAWSTADGSAGHLPVSVAVGYLPADLSAGDRVDVWVGPGPGEDPERSATLIAADLRVVDPGQTESLGTTVARTVLLDLGPGYSLEGAQVAALAAEHVTLVRVS